MMSIYSFRYALFFLLIFSTTQIYSQDIENIYRFTRDIKESMENDTVPWKYQTGAVEFSFVGDYPSVLATWDKAFPRGKMKSGMMDTLLLHQSTAVHAHNYIVQRAEHETVIIINEAHHMPRHRTFTAGLLEDLYDLGYRHLGLEALWDTLTNERKFAVLKSGYYTQEPEFGNLVYRAIQLGFHVFGYEASPDKNGKEREMEQAQNIKKYMEEHPDGKCIIHCGYDHVFENKVKHWEKAMAGRLKEYSGVDPFTIDQVKYSERSTKDFYPYLLESSGEEESYVLMDSKKMAFRGHGPHQPTDLIVFHPVTQYRLGRPDWLFDGRKIVFIPGKKWKKYQFPVLILAYRENESEKNGIPADVIEIRDKKDFKPLLLFHGAYDIIVKDIDYQVIDSFKMHVTSSRHSESSSQE